VLVSIGFTFWAYTPLGPSFDTKLVLQTNTRVWVEELSNAWIFTPRGTTPTTGFIFYPGARIDPRSYAGILMEIAEQGFLVTLTRMPFNLAVFLPNLASEIQTQFPEIENWVIGGHSLGGAMASSFASSHSEDLSGLILWAAYPAAADDLSDLLLPVLSMYGTMDGLVSLAEIKSSNYLLPPDTVFRPIAGDKNAQFGNYGDQAGDLPAEISLEEQHLILIDGTVGFLHNLEISTERPKGN
jgi:hypothetical protein